jgi:hypothetical protein
VKLEERRRRSRGREGVNTMFSFIAVPQFPTLGRRKWRPEEGQIGKKTNIITRDIINY